MTRPHILFEDNHLLIVEKPQGMPSVPDKTKDLSALDWAKDYVKRTKGKPGGVYLGVFHRIDRPVSGVLAFARTSKAARRLTNQMKKGEVEKVYLAITHRSPREASGTTTLYIKKDRKKNKVKILEGAMGHLAVTQWRVLGRIDEKRHLMWLKPITGRPHQLRVTMSHLGCPIEGDIKYGASMPLKDRSIALHAHILRFIHPVRSIPMEFMSTPKRYPFNLIPKEIWEELLQ